MNTTADLTRLIDLLHAGDETARDGLIGRACERLRLHARRMIRGFAVVRSHEQTDDVLHNSLIRLHRCLTEVQPESLAHFFALSGQAIRRELLDLAKRYRRVDSRVSPVPAGSPQLDGQVDLEDGPADLAQWSEFHEQVEALPQDEREVVHLVFYEQLSQREAAEVLGVAERTVLRRWHAARLKLKEVLADGVLG